MRPEEGRTFLDIHSRSVRGLAAQHYPPEVIDGWAARVTEESISGFMRNPDGDLGTGVGFLALRFSQAGALSTGIDIAQEQIQAARHRAESLGVAAQFHVAAAEETGLPIASFDVVTASQLWLYFDKERVIAEVKRLLAPEGLLLTSHFCWLPRQDAVAKASEQLVQFNPNWTAADLAGDVPFIPKWSEDHFRLHAMFVFNEQIPFTWESWRGRFRACRGVGATLEPKQIEAFDNQHDALLRRITPASDRRTPVPTDSIASSPRLSLLLAVW